MGANMSSVGDNTTPFATVNAPPPLFSPTTYTRHSPFANRINPLPAFPESTTAPPHPAATATVAPPPKAPTTATAATSGRVVPFHSSTSWRAYFQASKASNKLIVIDFTATWCGPCRYMEPTINEFAAKYTDVDFVKIDVDELYNISCEFGVQAMPTFIFIKKGKEIDKVTGTRKEELQMKIEKYRT